MKLNLEPHWPNISQQVTFSEYSISKQKYFLGSQWTYKFLGTFLTHFTWLKEKEKIYKTILSSTILQSSFNNLQETDTVLLKLVKSLEQKIYSPYMKFM